MIVTKHIHEKHLAFILNRDTKGLIAEEIAVLHEFMELHSYLSHNPQTVLCSPDFLTVDDSPICYTVTFTRSHNQYTIF